MDPATRSPPNEEGFLKRSLILEPIQVNRRLGDEFTVVPKDGDQVSVGEELLKWHAVDMLDYNVNLYHFANGLQRPTSNVRFWAVTIVESSHEVPGVRLAIGPNAASIWRLNGEEVIDIYNDRQTVIDDGVSKRLTLKKRSVIRAAIINAGGAKDFAARLLDATLGQSGIPL